MARLAIHMPKFRCLVPGLDIVSLAELSKLILAACSNMFPTRNSCATAPTIIDHQQP